jgi:hypothetical protein
MVTHHLKSKFFDLFWGCVAFLLCFFSVDFCYFFGFAAPMAGLDLAGHRDPRLGLAGRGSAETRWPERLKLNFMMIKSPKGLTF